MKEFRSRIPETGGHSFRRNHGPKPGSIWVGDRLLLRGSTGREVDGLWIGTIESDAESIMRRVEDAISVIRLRDPRRYRRLCHDLSRIWVRLLPGDLANFNSAIRACQLDSRHVRDEAVSASELAASIVHEAAHARIDRCVPYREELRDQIEAACVRRELAFARQLPDNDGLVERLHARLASPFPHAFWSDSEFEKRRVEGILEALCHLGVPRMLLPLFRATHRFSTAIRRRCKRSNNRLEPTNTAGRR